MSLESTLKEYCTVENSACTANSRRIRTQVAIAGSDEPVFAAGWRNPAASSRLDWPRSTSKSWLKIGCLGMRLSAEAICCCSSVEGEQTFRTLTFTLGAG